VGRELIARYLVTLNEVNLPLVWDPCSRSIAHWQRKSSLRTSMRATLPPSDRGGSDRGPFADNERARVATFAPSALAEPRREIAYQAWEEDRSVDPGVALAVSPAESGRTAQWAGSRRVRLSVISSWPACFFSSIIVAAVSRETPHSSRVRHEGNDGVLCVRTAHGLLRQAPPRASLASNVPWPRLHPPLMLTWIDTARLRASPRVSLASPASGLPATRWHSRDLAARLRIQFPQSVHFLLSFPPFLPSLPLPRVLFALLAVWWIAVLDFVPSRLDSRRTSPGIR